MTDRFSFICSTFLLELEKYETNPEDVGESFIEWVSEFKDLKLSSSMTDFMSVNRRETQM